MIIILSAVATVILRVFEILLILRAIMSWFPMSRNNVFSSFLMMMTEPLLLPFRSLFHRIEALRRIPFDFSFIVVYLLVEILLTLL